LVDGVIVRQTFSNGVQILFDKNLVF